MRLRVWIACVMIGIVVGCKPYPQPCDDGTFDGDIDQSRENFAAAGYDGVTWFYNYDEALERFAGCRSVTGTLSGFRKIEDRFFPNLERLGSISTSAPYDESIYIEELTGFDSLVELGGVFGTFWRVEGFSQIRAIDHLSGWDIIGFRNLESVGFLETVNPVGLSSVGSADYVRLRRTNDPQNVLPSLRTVSGSFIVADSKLQQLSFESIDSVGGDVKIASNGMATAFGGFAPSATIMGDFHFYGHPLITSDSVMLLIERGQFTVRGETIICLNTTQPATECPDGFSFRNLSQ
jgi:hypothetical protein